jgi:YD repeat-containing protein
MTAISSIRLVSRIVALASIGSLINGGVIQSSAAQDSGIPPPEFTLRDANYVDLVSFSLTYDLTDLTIGTKEHPLTHSLYSGPLPDTLLGNGYFRDGYYGWVNVPPASGDNCPNRTIVFGNETESFSCSKLYPVYSYGQTGATLLQNIYTRRDGTQIVYFPLGPDIVSTPVQQINYPDGRVLTYGACASGPPAGLLCSVTRSDGLQLKYNYTTLAGYVVISSVVAINNAVEYCDPTATTCSLVNAWPTVTYTWSGQAPGAGFASILTVTDPAGRQTRYTQDSKGRTVGIKLPTSASADNLTYTYCDSSSNWCSQFVSPWNSTYQNYVQGVVRNGIPWTYTGAPGGGSPQGTCGLGTYTVTNPVGGVEKVWQDYCFFGETGARLGSNPGTTPFMQLQTIDGTIFSSGISLQTPAPDIGGRISTVTKPEGNQTTYTWDNRGNLTQAVMTPKPGSPLAPVTLVANYDATCTITVKCNKPNWVKDGLGNETDYTYAPVHGGVLTTTLPADPNGIRPQTRDVYTQRYAWVLNSSGTYVQSAAPIWVLTTESFCRTTAAAASGTGCTVATDEVVKTYEYGPDAGPNNLFLKGVAVTADGVTQRTCYGYDPFGNKISETTPDAALTICP